MSNFFLTLTIIFFYSMDIVALTDSIPPITPQNVKAYGYEKHIDITWLNNSEPDLAGYKVYRKVSGQFVFYVNVPKEKSYLSLWLGTTGLTYTFKVSAYDFSGNESPLSDSVVASTHSMSDEEFLDMVQRATFRYFWDYAHPISGLARERLNSGNTVTIGGSGFGVMALLVGIERGYITRNLGVERMLKILNFLTNQASRYHGVFSHWLDGSTGATIPFSQYDNGGDLVETAFMIQGLLAARSYFNGSDSAEVLIRNMITNIWQSVEWDWYRRFPTSNFLYWHWSPNYNWQMNMIVQGPNEAQIVYLLAIASPTHGVPASLYHNGWASSSNYINGNTYYGYKIYVGWPYGGPLFFTHYSFLGFDPRNKKDAYANYFVNNRNITLIHKAYCTANPRGFQGYGSDCWGLTASDDPSGYRVHEPNNDNGTITPTAALSSTPYTPTESIGVIKHLYRTYGNQLWGEYGFKDAFNLSQNWFASSYLAIDQGPIIVMIENYRSGLLWNNFMANPEIQPMLNAIGFVPDSATTINHYNQIDYSFKLYGNYPNPFNPSTVIRFEIPERQQVTINIFNALGETVKELYEGELPKGVNEITWFAVDKFSSAVPSGVYFYRIQTKENFLNGKMILQR